MPRPDHGDEFEEEGEGAEESKGKKKRIDLSVAQVAGAGVATLTAATAASYLNVYGTVIGTGVMAVLSTTAAPVIQHWITRSGEQAKELAEKAEKKAARQNDVRALVDPDAEAAAEAHAQGGREAGTGHVGFDPGATRIADPEAPDPFGFPDDADATRTMAMPMLGRDLPGQTIAHGFGNPEDPTLLGGPSAADATELLPQVGGPGDTRYPGGPGGDDADDADDADGALVDERPKRGWKAVALSAAAVFTLVMLVILAFELLTGRSLTAWTQGQDEPTSPSLFGGHSAQVQDEQEDPETTGEQQTETENGTGNGNREQGTDAPVEPESTTPPVEPQPEVPGGGTDPVDPPVDGGEPVDPGGGEAPDPGTENPPEGDTPAEPAPAAPTG